MFRISGSQLKFTKNGIFIIKDEISSFEYFKNIKTLSSQIERDNKRGFITTYVKINNEYYSDDENATLYDLILKEWIKYHETEVSSLERKLDKFLETVEILPGGNEYEKAKLNFETLK